MIVDVRNEDFGKYKHLMTWDHDEKKYIEYCFFSNDKTGEYGAYKLDKDGKPYVENGETVREFKNGNIEICDPELYPEGPNGDQKIKYW